MGRTGPTWRLMRRGGRWYVLFRRRQYATGLEATDANVDAAERYALDIVDRHRRGEDLSAGRRRASIGEAFDLFLAERTTTRSPRTLTAYRSAFDAFVRVRSMPLTAANVTDMVRAAIARRTSVGAGWDTYRRSFQTFLTWCVGRGWLPHGYDVADLVPKRTPKRPRTFTHAELTDVVAYFDGRDPDMADLVRLLWATGLRIHEALGLTWRDVDSADAVLHVLSKDGRRREVVPVTRRGLAIIEAMRARRTAARRTVVDTMGRRRVYDQADQDTLFPWTMANYTRLRMRLVSALAAMGHDADGRSFHTIRKTFISDMARAGIDVRLASRLARCGIEVMMRHYTEIRTDEARRALEIVEDARA